MDPTKPKNFDKYTYVAGVVKGPEPVEALVLGNQEFTADKSRLFDLSEVNLGAVPATCQKAAKRAQIESGKCETIFVDWESASNTRTKAENEKKKADESADLQRQMKTGKMGRSDGQAAATGGRPGRHLAHLDPRTTGDEIFLG